jgi:hypothetical protein
MSNSWNTSCYNSRDIYKMTCPECNMVFVNHGDPFSVRQCTNCLKNFYPGQMIPPKNCKSCNLKYTGGNNVYYKDNCPAIMQDGRFITYYNSSNELTETLRKMNGFNSANQFRNFMQNNGDLFMATERQFLTDKNTCSPTTACSEGYYDLWTKMNGYWACDYASGTSLNH